MEDYDFKYILKLVIPVIVVFILSSLWGYVHQDHVIANRVEEADYYQTMRHAENVKDFNYYLKTNAGRTGIDKALVKASNPVTLPGLTKSYMFIKSTHEHYTQHIEHYTTTDSKGNTHWHTRVYWTWDYAGSQEKTSKKITINNVNAKYSDLRQDTKDLTLNTKNADLREIKSKGLFGITTSYKPRISSSGSYLYTSSDDRYYFKYVPESYHKTLFATLKDKKVLPLAQTKHIEQYDKSVKQIKHQYQQSVDEAQSHQILKAILWGIAITTILTFIAVLIIDGM